MVRMAGESSNCGGLSPNVDDDRLVDGGSDEPESLVIVAAVATNSITNWDERFVTECLVTLYEA